MVHTCGFGLFKFLSLFGLFVLCYFEFYLFWFLFHFGIRTYLNFLCFILFLENDFSLFHIIHEMFYYFFHFLSTVVISKNILKICFTLTFIQ